MLPDLRDDDFFFYFNMSGNILTYASAGAQLVQLDIIIYIISYHHITFDRTIIIFLIHIY